MKKSALVSVITPVFNAEAFIAETIESVIQQTYSNWELLLVNDNSTDASFSILKKYTAEDSRIKIFSFSENKGAGHCRNKGIEEAKGEFIAFLDADDLWKPQKLQKQLDFMLKNDAEVCFSSYQLMDEAGKKLPIIAEALSFLNFKKLEKSNYVGNLTGIYHAEKLGKIYAPVVRKRQDWALWLKAVQKAGMAYGIKESLAYYRVRKDSISGNKLEMLSYNYNIYRKELNYGSLRSFYKMAVFLKEHFFIKKKQLKKLK